MTAAELNEIADMIDDTYPNTATFGSTNALEMWNDVIGEYTKEAVAAAVRSWVRDNPYAPKPSDIRKLVKKAGASKRPKLESINWLFYYKEVDGTVYEYVAIVARDKEELAQIRAAGYGQIPVVQLDSPKYRQIIRENDRIYHIRKGTNDVQNQDIHNFRRDDQEP